MLSLRGSIQPDPFSPAHVPQMTMKAMSEPASESSTAVVRDVILPFEEEEEGEDEEIDMFERLGRMGDEAVALEAKRRAEEEATEAAKAKEKKRKRKDSGNEGKGIESRSKLKGERHNHKP